MREEIPRQHPVPYFILHLKGGQTRWHQDYASHCVEHERLKISSAPHLCFRFSEEHQRYELIPLLQND